MIDLSDLRRVRLHSGRLVHAVTPGTRQLACGGYVHMESLWGGTWDVALEPEATVTCRSCARIVLAGGEARP